MLALDIQETFDKENNECKTGERLKNTVLYKGSGDVAKELYRRFQVSVLVFDKDMFRVAIQA